MPSNLEGGGTNRPVRCRSRVWRLVALGALALGLAAPGILRAQVSVTVPSLGQTGALTPMPSAAAIPSSLLPNLAAPEVPDNYRIGINDLLTVFVYQMPEMTSQVRVDSSGDIRVPLLRRPIPAAGVTAPVLAERVQRELVLEQMARNPQVQVVVRQVESRPIVVVGAVKFPTVLQAARPMRLTEVLARTGGLDSDSGNSVLLTTGPDTARVTRHIDLATLLTTAGTGDDPLLSGNDLVRVSPARRIYVTGALAKPGAFALQTDERISVLKALALAQGFSSTEPADKKHDEIIRTSANGSRTVIPINIDRILKLKDPNPMLEAGDLLYVPENGRSKMLATVAGDIAQAGIIAFGYNATHVF
ncbi:MAG: polysaccharide biosynthesis/export family protein [Terriglobales bacterium]